MKFRSTDHPMALKLLTVSEMLDIEIFQLRSLHTFSHFIYKYNL